MTIMMIGELSVGFRSIWLPLHLQPADVYLGLRFGDLRIKEGWDILSILIYPGIFDRKLQKVVYGVI